MKNGKKLILIALVLLMVGSMLTAGTYAMKYARIHQDQSRTVSLGDAGISYANAFRDGTVQVSRRNDSGYHAPSGWTHVANLLEVRFYDLKWNRDRTVAGNVAVFYNLNGKQQRMWNAGLLSIYYYDTWKNQWKACPSFELKNGTRIACRIYSYGVYGLMYRVVR